MQKCELLAPAGNFEKLKIALAYGADAVYGGVSHFSLRIRSSKEFDYDTFKEAIDYTHSLGKKIYVTINGFIYNSQIQSLKKHIEIMASYKPDAFIVSTPGVIMLAKEIAPEIDIHLSTQANVMNYLDAKVYASLGVKRIIAAREISLNDLVAIKQNLPQIELEAFVHGSMCFAYSGRCLISSLQSGRVPNRGSCANDCRFPYKLYAKNEENGVLLEIEEDEEGTHIMNAKDLNLSGYVDKILDSEAVDSLKIEGRTKSPYYVAVTTLAYRMAIDDYYSGEFEANKYQKLLDGTKHRGFSDGYLIKRAYEKSGDQLLEHSISEGENQVCAIVEESGRYFMTKDKIEPNIFYKILLPLDMSINEIENDIGIVRLNGNSYEIMFKKIEAKSGKIFEAIHSGNLNPVILPTKLPPFSFLYKSLKQELV